LIQDCFLGKPLPQEFSYSILSHSQCRTRQDARNHTSWSVLQSDIIYNFDTYWRCNHMASGHSWFLS
jgi:hypothetical protein